MIATKLLLISKSFEMTNSTGYVIGAVIALFIFGYLFYSLVKPEKF
jgi:K+-transporting ATPase KdpF subunit